MRFRKLLLAVLILSMTIGATFYRYDPETQSWIKLEGLNEYGSVELIGEKISGYCNKSVWDIGVSIKAKIETPPGFSFIKTAEAVTSNITTLPDGTFRVPNKQEAEWRVTIEIISDEPIDNVVIEDNFGGEFGVAQNPIYKSAGTVEISYKGETQKAFLRWTLGNNFSGKATLILKVYTDRNPAGRQEFTASKEHILNSGAVLHYTVGNTNYTVTVPNFIRVISYGS